MHTTLGAVFLAVKKTLSSISFVDSPEFETAILITHFCKCSREDVVMYPNKKISKLQLSSLQKAVTLRTEGLPLLYITKQTTFYGRYFYCAENVLIPRQDTESLVYTVVNLVQHINALNILDLCCGTGCVGISTIKELRAKHKDVSCCFVDTSSDAIKLVKKNIKSLDVHDVSQVQKKDLFNKDFKIDLQRYNLVVSNPPYIKTKLINTLHQDVQKEPFLALNGGEDGLLFYRRISYLFFEGILELLLLPIRLQGTRFLAFEIGYDQAESVIEIIDNMREKCIADYLSATLSNEDCDWHLTQSVENFMHQHCKVLVDTAKDFENRDRVVTCTVSLLP